MKVGLRVNTFIQSANQLYPSAPVRFGQENQTPDFSDEDDLFFNNENPPDNADSLRDICKAFGGITYEPSEMMAPHNTLRELTTDDLKEMAENGSRNFRVWLELATRYQHGRETPRDIKQAEQCYRTASKMAPEGKYWCAIFLLNELAMTEHVPLSTQFGNAFRRKPWPTPLQAEAYQLFYLASISDQSRYEVQEAVIERQKLEQQLAPKALLALRLALQKKKT